MTNYPESGVKLVVDTKEAQSTLDDLLSSLDDIQGQEYSASVTIEADTSDVDTALGELPTEGETITTELNVTETDTAKETLNAVETIKNLKVLETVWNIAGTAVDIFGKFASYAVQPMLSLDSAVARVNATTGNTIPNAKQLIKDIFYDDLGESIDQVANLVIQAEQLKVPIDDAVRAALTFTHTFSDQNPKQVLDAMNQLVLTGLVPNFETAGDVLVKAFQNGADKGGDLLTALNNNANAIRDMGLTGPEALSFIKTGLDNGFKSAQDVLQALEKIKQNVTNAAGNQTSDVSKTLKILGIANPAETGEAWSAEFFKKVIDGIKNQPGLTDSEREVLFTNLIGGKQGGKTFSAFLAMSPADADTIFANVAGAAERAATEVDNSLQGAIDDFRLAAEQAVQDWLSSSAIDLPGKIAALKTGLQDALNVLAEGGSLSQALTVALKPIGFDDEFQVLEKSLGDFVIGILQAVKQIQELTGHGTEAQGTQATIADLSQKQLAFNLEIKNPDDLSSQIAIATARGLSAEQISSTISASIEQLVKDGAIKQAQALLDELKKNAPNYQKAENLPTGLEISKAEAALREGGDRLKAAIEEGLVVNVTPSITKEMADTLQDEIDDALSNLNPTMDSLDHTTTNAATQLNSVSNAASTVDTKAGSAASNLTALAQGTDKAGGAAKAAARPTQNVAVAMDGVTNSAPPAATSLWELVPALDQIANKANAVGAAADSLAAKNTGGGNEGSTTPAPTTTTGGGPATPNSSLSGITSALLSYVPTSSTTSGGGNNFTAVNNNFVQSTAQADRLGFSTAETLRGMAGGV